MFYPYTDNKIPRQLGKKKQTNNKEISMTIQINCRQTNIVENNKQTDKMQTNKLTRNNRTTNKTNKRTGNRQTN